MKRLSILAPALLALVVAGCGETATPSQTATAMATPQPTATPEPTDEPTASPEPAGENGGSDTALADLVPDELNGVPRTDIPGLEARLGPALAGMGTDASEVEFVFAAYGEGTGSVALNAFRIPGMDEPSLQLLAAMMAGSEAGSEVDAEPVTIGGKSVLRLTAPEAGGGTVYMYFAEDAIFTIVSESAESTEQLLAELP